jgi:hypothetical protein
MQQCGSKKSDTSKVKVNLLVVVVVFAAAEKKCMKFHSIIVRSVNQRTLVASLAALF